MSYKCDLTTSEKSLITFELAKGKSTLEISKIIGRYQETGEKICCTFYKSR